MDRSKYSWYNHDRRSVSRAVEPNGKEERSSKAASPEKDGANDKEVAKPVTDAEPTVEQVDEMIKEAQKERKQGFG